MPVSEKERPVFALFAVWRLLAALLVMFFHFGEFGPPAWKSFCDSMIRLSPLLDLFFIGSGLLIWVHYSDKLTSWADYRVFVLRRLARLYPLHIATLSVFCLAWAVAATGIVETNLVENYSLSELMKQLLLVNAWGFSDSLTFNFVSWSLSAEWFCYLLFPLIVFLFRKAGLKGLVALLLVVVALLEGLTYWGLMPFPTWLEANTWGAYRVFADFVLGAIIANLAFKKLLTIKSHVLAWAALALAIGVMLADLSWGYWSIFAIAFALYIAAQVEINAPKSSAYLKPLMPISFVSFGIYMWHPVFAISIFGLGWMHFLEPRQIGGFTPLMIFAIVVSVTTAYLSAKYFEAPCRQIILALVRRSPARDSKIIERGTAASHN
ncbi:acyltransferase [uncultured Cohaesibacter sp.]|uniref:acyltransferase family protein n=1 Tax=uncultured Cohaesibacter sp. TaxID=1002546 RepID=UPI00293166FC|nr:acyltransferase [uncultured Cohaesibacter sp.]